MIVVTSKVVLLNCHFNLMPFVCCQIIIATVKDFKVERNKKLFVVDGDKNTASKATRLVGFCRLNCSCCMWLTVDAGKWPSKNLEHVDKRALVLLACADGRDGKKQVDLTS